MGKVVVKADALQERIEEALDTDFGLPVTMTETLAVMQERIGDGNELGQAVKASLTTLRNGQDAVNGLREAVKRDRTLTPAAKMVRLRERTAKTISAMSGAIDTMARAAVKAEHEAREKLFTNSQVPDEIDRAVLEADFTRLARTLPTETESEARITAAIIRRYPSALPENVSPDHRENILSGIDAKYTPDAANTVEAASYIAKRVTELVAPFVQAREAVLPSDVLEEIDKRRVGK